MCAVIFNNWAAWVDLIKAGDNPQSDQTLMNMESWRKMKRLGCHLRASDGSSDELPPQKRMCHQQHLFFQQLLRYNHTDSLKNPETYMHMTKPMLPCTLLFLVCEVLSPGFALHQLLVPHYVKKHDNNIQRNNPYIQKVCIKNKKNKTKLEFRSVFQTCWKKTKRHYFFS